MVVPFSGNVGRGGKPWRLLSILTERNPHRHYVERHAIQSLLGMKLNLVGGTTGHGLSLATTTSGLFVLKHRLDSFNRKRWELWHPTATIIASR